VSSSREVQRGRLHTQVQPHIPRREWQSAGHRRRRILVKFFTNFKETKLEVKRSSKMCLENLAAELGFNTMLVNEIGFN
jgi:hypothetical protein